MLAVVTNSQRKRDAIDIEFDAVSKADQLNRGIKYNGLFLVGAEPAPVVAEVKAAPVVKRGFKRIFEEIVFGDTVA